MSTTIEFENQIRDGNFQLTLRILSGKVNYQRDAEQIASYIRLAQQHHITHVIGILYNTYMLLNVAVGRYRVAIDTLDQGIAHMQSLPDLGRDDLAVMVVNKAEALYLLGHPAQALDLLTDYFGDFMASTTPITDILSAPQLFYAYVGNYYLALRDLNHAQLALECALKMPPTNDEINLEQAIFTALLGTIDLAMFIGSYAEAINRAQVLYWRVRESSDPLARFRVECALAHVATTPYIAKIHYAQAVATAQQIKTFGIRVLAVMHEARYHQRHGNVEQRHRFAKLARGMVSSSHIDYFDAEIERLLADE